MEFRFRNVNDAFTKLVAVFNEKGNLQEGYIVKEPSRNGQVLRINEPVLISYSHPLERVLFNAARDVNPFSLLYEALHMIAGRNDVAPLTYYTKQFKEYSDDGKTLNGAYGYRWRNATEHEDGDTDRRVDQLDILVAHLKAQPNSRRAILQMWNVEDDLLKIDTSKDTCCNLSVMFSIREEGIISAQGVGRPDKIQRVLDITVTNRSNDMVWGALGANYVCFSVLQEYMAARIGVEVGHYHHFTNNLHCYTETNSGFKPEEWFNDKTPNYYVEASQMDGAAGSLVPLVQDPETFEAELPRFVEQFDGTKPDQGELPEHWDEPFFSDVAQPMLVAFACHKERDYHGAFSCIAGIEDSAWRIVCENWIRRRSEKYAASK